MGNFLQSLFGRAAPAQGIPGQTGPAQVVYPSGTSAADFAPPARTYYRPQASVGPGFYSPDPARPYGSIWDIAKAVPARALADIVQLPTGVLEYVLGRAAEPGAANYARNVSAAETLAALHQTEAGRAGLTNIPEVSQSLGIEQPTEATLPPRAYSPQEQYQLAQTGNLLDLARRRAALFGGGLPGGAGDFGPTGFSVDMNTGNIKLNYGPEELKTVPRGTIPQGAPAPPPGAPPAAAPPPAPGAPPPRGPRLLPSVPPPGTPPIVVGPPPTGAGAEGAPGAAPGAPGAPAEGAPGAPPVRRPTRVEAPPRAVGAGGPSPAAIPQSEIDAAHQTRCTTPVPPIGPTPTGAPPPSGVAPPPPVPPGPPAAGGPRTRRLGQTIYVEQPTPYSEDGKVLQTLRTNPAIDALVQQAGGDPDLALQDPTVGPRLQFEVDAAKRAGKFTEAQQAKTLESDVIVKRWLSAAKTARDAATELYGPITDAKGQPIFNEETGQPYTFEDVLIDSPTWSMFGESRLGKALPQWAQLTPEARLTAISKDKTQPEGLRKAALRVLAGPTIRPKLAKASGEVGNLNTMEQTVFDSLIVGPNSTRVEGRGRRDLLFRLLDNQTRLLQSGQVDALTAANNFRAALNAHAQAAGMTTPDGRPLEIRPRDRLLSNEELAAEVTEQGGFGGAPPTER
jgi:hypothetical protein